MNSVVIYGSHFGNTKKVADAIAAGLRSFGPVQLLAAEDVPSRFDVKPDLVVVGGPTEAFHMTHPVMKMLDRLEPLDGVAAAAFDTRVKPRWYLPGHAAPGIEKRLQRLGARIVAPPEGFLVEGEIKEAEGKFPTLVAGELERASRWGASLAARVEVKTPATANA